MCYFLFSVLAVWRITHLIVREDGPFDVVFLLRKKAGRSFWGKLMDCFYCSSVWIALPFGYWLGTSWWERLLDWWALSGAACLLERATDKPDTPFFKED
ncbi:hypothetical protein LL912_20485 [Niabella sp. CC-SYL272]|uniref:DUF1360 domain-containing protein n=1 Tax=Niabella agricola TaxID=2891571 RepID=UPI001F36ACD7|nr:hypothetical protein [Niabella agricola]MCF3111178.1 hypothetical protein [Niabella agricola]